MQSAKHQTTVGRMRPLCFVLMPFGKKPDPSRPDQLDFDRIYDLIIEPAIDGAGLEPIRADREVTGGIIHKPMFERLLLCDFAVADLTAANANVFYELGVRHATRPHTTLPIFADHHRIPFDVQMLRGFPYKLGERNELTEERAKEISESLRKRLSELRAVAHEAAAPDSPLVQLLEGYRCPDVSHLRTDIVQARLATSAKTTREISTAKRVLPADAARKQLRAIEEAMGDLRSADQGTTVALFLAYRGVEAHDEMLRLHDLMPVELKRVVLIREQRAFALNRLAGAGKQEEKDVLRDEAIEVLEAVIAEKGSNAETYGLLGRIHKDRWSEAVRDKAPDAEAHLRFALSAYRRGFEADLRDTFPGVNLVTLLEIEGSEESMKERARVLPVVRFAAEQRVKPLERADYWDFATLVEVEVADQQFDSASKYLALAISRITESWQPSTTARNLELLLAARRDRGMPTEKIEAAIATLKTASSKRK